MIHLSTYNNMYTANNNIRTAMTGVEYLEWITAKTGKVKSEIGDGQLPRVSSNLGNFYTGIRKLQRYLERHFLPMTK